jgi:hypothetical protein
MLAALLVEVVAYLGIQRAEPYSVMGLEHALVLPQTKCAMADLVLAVSLEPERQVARMVFLAPGLLALDKASGGSQVASEWMVLVQVLLH